MIIDRCQNHLAEPLSLDQMAEFADRRLIRRSLIPKEPLIKSRPPWPFVDFLILFRIGQSNLEGAPHAARKLLEPRL